MEPATAANRNVRPAMRFQHGRFDLGHRVDVELVLGQQPLEERLETPMTVIDDRGLEASGEERRFEIADVVSGDMSELKRALAAGQELAELLHGLAIGEQRLGADAPGAQRSLE